MRLPKTLMGTVASALILGACASPYGPEYAYSPDPYPYGYRYSSGYYPTGYYAPQYGYYGWPRYSSGGYYGSGPHMTIAASF
jgi:hypothetical protein